MPTIHNTRYTLIIHSVTVPYQGGSECPAHRVHPEGVQGIVEGEYLLELAAVVAHGTAEQSEEECGVGVDIPRGRGDGDQTGHGPGAQPNNGGHSGDVPLHKHPGESSHPGSDLGVQHGHTSDLISYRNIILSDNGTFRASIPALADPALNPNQPTHSILAPTTVSISL